MVRKTIRERFERYDTEHPEVYKLFKHFARQLRKAGKARYSSRVILERIRWHYAIRGREVGSEFKINDQFSPHYARKLAAEHPRLYGGFFEFRRLRAAAEAA